jgi:two-component system response regulator FixJ
MTDQARVFIVEPQESVRRAYAELFASVQLPTAAFSSADEFLAAASNDQLGCLILEVRLPGTSGLELLGRLRRWKPPLPAIVVTGHADVALSVESMRAGAFDFFEKPARDQALLDSVTRALDADRVARRRTAQLDALRERAERLTPREGEVMKHVVFGLPNKAVARELGVTRKAVEAYRARVMRKMEAESLAELVRMSVVLETAAGHEILPESAFVATPARSAVLAGPRLVHADATAENLRATPAGSHFAGR